VRAAASVGQALSCLSLLGCDVPTGLSDYEDARPHGIWLSIPVAAEHPLTPRCELTGYGDTKRRQCLNRGAADYLAQPRPLTDLVRRHRARVRSLALFRWLRSLSTMNWPLPAMGSIIPADLTRLLLRTLRVQHTLSALVAAL